MEIYTIAVSAFYVLDEDDKKRFFEENFLLANVKPDVVLGMLFLTMSNVDVDFQAQDIEYRSYITGNVLPITRRVEFIEKKEFAVAAFDQKHETFIVRIAALSSDSGNDLHPLKRAEIPHLKADKALTENSSKYADFVNIFSSKLAIELPEHIGINDHAIELVDD